LKEKKDKYIHTKRDPHTKENGKEASEMDTEYKNGLMDHIMKVNGILVLLMGTADSSSATEINIKAIGLITWPMATVFFIIKMEIFMKASF
jgi:hypothetical protein